MAQPFTLYRKNGSCSMVSHVLLTELSIPFNSVLMRPGTEGYEAADGSFTHAEYRKIHPSGYVPALRLTDAYGGATITENPAILRFIANLAPERSLLGKTALERARVDEWLAWLSGTLHGSGFGAYWRPARFVGEHEEMYDTVRGRGHQTILSAFDRIDDRVEGKHAVGGDWTVVDLYLHTFYRWGTKIGVDMSQYSKYTEAMREIEKLETLRKIMALEGEKLQFDHDT